MVRTTFRKGLKPGDRKTMKGKKQV